MLLFDEKGMAITRAWTVVTSEGKIVASLYLSRRQAVNYRKNWPHLKHYKVVQVPISFGMAKKDFS